MPKSREEEILKSCIQVLKKLVHPEKIYLFGSRAKGIADSHADFDLAYEGGQNHLSLKEQLEEVSGLYTVDCIDLSKVDSDFKKIVLENGKLIYERN